MKSEVMGPTEKAVRPLVEKITTPALIGMPVTLNPEIALAAGKAIEALAKLIDIQEAQSYVARCFNIALAGIFACLAAVVAMGYFA